MPRCWPTRRVLSILPVLAVAVIRTLNPEPARALDTVAEPIEVTVDVADERGVPLPDLPLRVTTSSVSGWDRTDSGVRGSTNERGTARLAVPGAVEFARIKRPTNFLSSLVNRPEAAHRVELAVELQYLDEPWLYSYGLCRFADGTVVLTSFDVRERDVSGRYTRRVPHGDEGWRFPSLQGLVLTTPGFTVRSFDLSPGDPVDGRPPAWRVRLSLHRAATPVRR